MRRMFSKLRILVAALGVTLGTGEATAGLLPVDPTITATGNAYQYSYAVDLTSNSSLSKGDYFTIYHFNGYIAGSNQQPTGFTESISTTGPIPPGTNPTNSTGGTNVTFTYTGDATLNGPTNLGTFSIDSTIGGTTTGSFAAQTHRTVDGVEESNITSTDIPVPTCTPEPATLLLLGMALPVAGLTRWMRRKEEE